MAIKRGTKGNDTITGTSADDIIYGLGGQDNLSGGAGNDLIIAGGGGSDKLDGGSGFDSAVLSFNLAQWHLSFTNVSGVDHLLVQRGAVTEDLTGIESVSFDDQLVLIVGAGGFSSISAALAAAGDGDLILVQGGTYTEQVVVTGLKDVTIMALPGDTVTIQAPAVLQQTVVSSQGRDLNSVVTVIDSTNITFDNINVDGAGRGAAVTEGTGAGTADFVGITYRNSSGDLLNVDVTGVRDSTLSGAQRGQGIRVDNDSLLHFGMSGGSISDFQKNATVFAGADLDIHGVTITGSGPTALIAQNGFQAYNSTGSIHDNIVRGLGYIGGNSASLILLYGNTDLDVKGNTLTGTGGTDPNSNSEGVFVTAFPTLSGSAVTSGGEISGNAISNVLTGIDVTEGSAAPLYLTDPVSIHDNSFAALYGVAEGVYFAPDPASTVDFTIGGSAFADELYGAAGDDALSGLGGNDVIDGGAGDDTMTGGAGDDVYTVDSLADTVIEESGGVAGYDQVTANVENYTLAANVERLQLGTGILAGSGNAGNNAIFGNAANNVIAGGAGDDAINGGGGIDTATYAGAATISEAGGNFTVTDAGGTDTLYGVEVVDDAASGRVLLVGNGGYATLQAAIDAANDGDTIRLASGTIAGDATVNKAVTIEGANHGLAGDDPARGAESVLSGSLFIPVASVTVDGVEFTGYARDHGFAFYGAISSYGADLTVENSVFAGSAPPAPAFPGDQPTSAAIEHGGTGLDVSNNVFSGYDVGLYVAAGSTGSVHDNIFTGDGVGSGTGLGNGVNSETVAVTIADNVFDGLYASNIATFPVGVAAVDMNTYILANTFVNAVARPISFFPIDGTASVVGTSYNESFRLDEGSLTTGISADAGGGNDALYGSMYGDTLTGGTGNDRIEGNGGADTAVFAGTYAGHSISYAAGVVTVTDTNIADGDTGTDTIIGVERLSFSDRGVLIVDAAALSGSGTYTTIQSAIDAAQAGDTIIVRAGTYTEDLSVTKSVTILGAFAGTEGQSATRTASSAMGETNIIGHATVSSAALVTIDGLRFEETALVASYGLVHISSGNATVTNSVFYSDVKGAGSEVRAVYASPGSGGTATISHNYITGAFPGYGYSGNGSFQRGVWYDGSDGSALVVDHNKIEYTRSGVNVDMSGASTAVVSSNEFHVVATGTAVGVDTDGFSLVGNSYLDTGEELNLRNITTPITYDATDDVVSIAVSSGTAYYNILGGTANDTITGTAFNDVLEGNQLVHGGDAARYAPGTDTDADTFYGMAGNDMLFGEGGNDYLDGGTGADVMVGGQGNDTYVVDDAGDQTIEGDTSTVNFGVDTVLTTLGVYTLEANVENLTNIGNQTLTATGNALANVMTGGSGRDVFAGGDGNDTLIGGDGNDALFGNGGDDTMIGGAGNDIYVLLGNDTIVELANGGTDEVRANKSLNLNDYANIENGTLLSPGGAASVLTLTGTAGNNTLIGNSGDNIIIGGAGRDLITGGGGADTFRYTTALPNQSGIGAQADRITDFIDYVSDNQKYDLIDVFAIDAKANSAGNNAFSFIGSAAFTAEGQIRVIDNGTDTIIEFNTSGTTGAEMQIVLSGHHMISDVNFLL